VRVVDVRGGARVYRVTVGLPEAQLGPIGRLLRGRRLADIVPEAGGVEVRTLEGLAVRVQWRSDGAEFAGLRWQPDGWGSEIHLPESVRYVRGRPLDSALTHDGLLLVVLADGHAIRFEFNGAQPEATGVSCYVMLPSPGSSLATAGAVA
jgi:hypothetical protein